jgi:DNA-binding CsgD family transcriptional regulator
MSQTLTRALLGAVAPLHESPQDPGTWSDALAALARAIPCEQAALVERLGRAANSGLGLIVGTDARFISEYQREYHRIDPFASEDVVSRLQHLGRAALSGEVLADVELQRSEFYGEFLARYGDLFHGVGGSFPIADHSHAHVWLLRPRGRAFTESERARMDVFFAHARAALRQRRWLIQIQRERDAALAWMDCWNDPTFVLDAQAGVIIANLTGERLVHAGECLVLRGGRLRPAKSHDADWVGNSIRALLTESEHNRAAATRCMVVPGRAGLSPLHAIFTTLPSADNRSTGSPPRVALILRDLRQALPHFSPAQLKDMFGFTAAETRVANALLGGQSVEDISRSTDVRRDTVRAHVKRMLAKSGTRRQSDLQKILVKALPNLRSLQAASSAAVDASLDIDSA